MRHTWRRADTGSEPETVHDDREGTRLGKCVFALMPAPSAQICKCYRLKIRKIWWASSLFISIDRRLIATVPFLSLTREREHCEGTRNAHHVIHYTAATADQSESRVYPFPFFIKASPVKWEPAQSTNFTPYICQLSATFSAPHSSWDVWHCWLWLWRRGWFSFRSQNCLSIHYSRRFNVWSFISCPCKTV